MHSQSHSVLCRSQCQNSLRLVVLLLIVVVIIIIIILTIVQGTVGTIDVWILARAVVAPGEHGPEPRAFSRLPVLRWTAARGRGSDRGIGRTSATGVARAASEFFSRISAT